MKKKFVGMGAWVAGLAAAVFVAGCAEEAVDPVPVAIPNVEIACTEASCLTSGTYTAYVFYTNYGCDQRTAQIGTEASGSVSVACTSGAGCAGTVTQWGAGETTTIPSGVYNICAYIDFNGNWTGDPDADDLEGEALNIVINDSSTTQRVTTWGPSTGI